MEGVSGAKRSWVLVFAAVFKTAVPCGIFNCCIVFGTLLFPCSMVIYIFLINSFKLFGRFVLAEFVIEVQIMAHILVCFKAFAEPIISSIFS